MKGWPANSPPTQPNHADLNPIENFWAEITRGWQSVFPRNRQTLEPYIVANWGKMRGNTQYFHNLYASMSRRVQEVIDRNGGTSTTDKQYKSKTKTQ